ncbi:SusC/RagA family TonB-linked outer membrane protein [Niabella sp. CC-SYL272]|uniref:SusC/RagA family TonB-linked outer membrane protein n=1 Tax=Niabella agricola TaxID=2891571 RepID=UPI001F22A164|nr:SusC/RagA family TonB-linked outer membrane protein [Niabella agricola]MCF3110565.1 SusC/RagA family TonB-linked outer membrane protein [Niabella agricola]
MIVQSTIHRVLRLKPLLLGLTLLLAPVLLFAQGKTVKGIVTSKETSEPIVNATVLIRGTSRGTTTNAQGQYSIAVMNNEVLVFSAVGYREQQRKVEQQTIINIALEEEGKQEEEVVVTALGIKRQEKALGYALTKIDSAQLTDAVSSNWTDALSGKVAGLNLIRSGSGPAGSNKIILRGENNLTGDNEALIVVDGVVINNSSGKRSANGSDNVYATGADNLPADYGSSLNDLNPQDIESVSVLKGPAAAALYGQRGANGAIIITTKSASAKKKGQLSVRFTSNGSMESINRTIDRQYEYGLGLDGQLDYDFGRSANSSSSSAYGPKLDGQLFYQYDPVTQTRSTVATPWVAYRNIDDFWDVGKNLTNNLSVNGKIGTTAFRLSGAIQNNKWIVPNTGFDRKSASLSTTTDITKKLKLLTKVNYGFRSSDNLPAAGYGNQSLMYWYMFWQPNADFNWLRNYWMGSPGSSYSSDSMYRRIRYPYSSFPENPFAIVNEFINKTRRHNVTGNVQLNYELTKELSLMVRGNLDWSRDKREQDRPYDAGSRLPQGSVRKQDVYARELSYDFLVRYHKSLSKDIKFGASLGGSQLRNVYNKTDVRADGLKFPKLDSLKRSPYPGMYNLDSNLYGLLYIPDTSRYQINSVYGVVNFSYKNYLFLELTGRQDWNSVLATADRTDNVGFFYPSVNTSFVLSDFTQLPTSISYAKLRASIAQVGSGATTPYRTAYTYLLSRTNGLFPDSAVANPRTLPNDNLKPLKTTTFELGTEVQLFKNRVGFDLAVYWGNTKNQILTRTLDRSSGYDYAIINAGRVNNSGVELSLNGKPIVNRNGFNWDVSATFASNKNKIISMPDSVVLLRSGQIASGQIVATIGGSMGDLYGLGYQRSPDGQVIFDPATGFPKITSNIIYLGNTTPKYKMSIGNTFRYRQFNLKVLFDAQAGAVGYSLTHYKMVEQGKLKSTLPGRYNGIIGNGVLEVLNDKGEVTGYRKNDVVAYDVDQYYQNSMGSLNAEGSTFSTDFIKFREASINYAFKPRLLKRIGLSSAQIGIYGRDLFIWSPWPVFDPEFGTLSGSDIVTGFEVGQFPSTRTLGFNLSIGF